MSWSPNRRARRGKRAAQPRDEAFSSRIRPFVLRRPTRPCRRCGRRAVGRVSHSEPLAERRLNRAFARSELDRPPRSGYFPRRSVTTELILERRRRVTSGGGAATRSHSRPLFGRERLLEDSIAALDSSRLV